MSKIWEVDFLSFSGSSDTLYDRIGTQHLVTNTNIIKTSLPEFVVRSGVSFGNNITSRFDFSSAAYSNVHVCPTRGGNYNYRSFAVWVYIEDPVDSNKWDTYCNLFGAIAGSSIPNYNGLGLTSSSSSRTLTLSLLTQGGYRVSTKLTVAGWYLCVFTVDRVANQCNLYVNGSLIGSTTSMPDDNGQTQSYIGFYDGSTAGTYKLGRVSTYNHILNSTEVLDIYNAFLPDDLSDNYPFSTISGNIYGSNGLLACSGTKAYLLNSSTYSVVDCYTTSGDGIYSLSLPSSGNYILLSKDMVGLESGAVHLTTLSGTIDVSNRRDARVVTEVSIDLYNYTPIKLHNITDLASYISTGISGELLFSTFLTSGIDIYNSSFGMVGNLNLTTSGIEKIPAVYDFNLRRGNILISGSRHVGIV